MHRNSAQKNVAQIIDLLRLHLPFCDEILHMHGGNGDGIVGIRLHFLLPGLIEHDVVGDGSGPIDDEVIVKAQRCRGLDDGARLDPRFCDVGIKHRIAGGRRGGHGDDVCIPYGLLDGLHGINIKLRILLLRMGHELLQRRHASALHLHGLQTGTHGYGSRERRLAHHAGPDDADGLRILSGKVLEAHTGNRAGTIGR